MVALMLPATSAIVSRLISVHAGSAGLVVTTGGGGCSLGGAAGGDVTGA